MAKHIFKWSRTRRKIRKLNITFHFTFHSTWCILARGMSWRTSWRSWVRHSRSSPPTQKQEMVWPSSWLSRRLGAGACVSDTEQQHWREIATSPSVAVLIMRVEKFCLYICRKFLSNYVPPHQRRDKPNSDYAGGAPQLWGAPVWLPLHLNVLRPSACQKCSDILLHSPQKCPEMLN